MLQKLIKQNKTASIIIVLLLVVSIFTIPGLYLIGNTTLACQRAASTQMNCTMTDNRWLGFVSESQSISQITQVLEYASTCRVGSGSKACRNIVFVTANEELPINLPREWVGDMNKFLQSTEPTFTMTRDNNLLGFSFIAIGLVTALIFGGLFLSRQPKIVSYYRFDKNGFKRPRFISQGKSPVKAGLALMAIATLLILVGLYLVGNNTLTCQRVESTQVNCLAVENRWLGLMSRSTLTLNNVIEAKSVNARCSSRGSAICPSLVIVTSQQEIQPNIILDGAANQVNQFLPSTQPSLTIIVQDWIRGAVFGGIGGVMLLLGLMILLTK